MSKKPIAPPKKALPLASNAKAKPTLANKTNSLGSSKKATTTNSKATVKPKEVAKSINAAKTSEVNVASTAPVSIEMSEDDKKEHHSATTIQKYWRRHSSKNLITKLRKEKEEYENKIKNLEQEAYLQMIKMEQEKEERKRAKILKEKMEKLKQEKRRKKFLETAYDGNVEELKFLIDELQQELNTRDDLESAQKKGLIFKLIESKDSNNNTALSEASASGNADIVKFLISKGADPNVRGAFDRTALWRAAFASHLEVAQILLQNGADPRLYTNDGQRPIDVATDKTISELLETWNIALTERMLQQIKRANEQNAKDQIKSLETICQNAEKDYENAKKDFELLKTKLFNLNQELNRLHDEYLLNEKLYGELIDVREAEKSDLKLKFEILREDMVKKRIKYREMLYDYKREKRELKKDLLNENDDEDITSDDESDESITKVNIKEIDDMIMRDLSGLISKANKWPLIIDQNDQACTFLRYRDTNYINCFDTKNMQIDKFRLALLGSIRYGKPFVLDLMEYDEELFEAAKVVFNMIDPSVFNSLLDKSLLQGENYMKLVRPSDGTEYEVQNFSESRIQNFKLIFLTSVLYPADEILSKTLPIRIVINTKY